MSPWTRPLGHPARRTRPALVLAVALFTLAAVAPPAQGAAERRPAWSAAALDLAARLPIQEGGRVMPLATFAEITLLRLNHRKGGTDDRGRALEPVEFLLDLLVRPDLATRFPIFVVDDVAVLDALGLPPIAGKHKRDRYTYAELAPAREALWERSKALEDVARARRSPVEDGIVDLQDGVLAFERLGTCLAFAQRALDTSSMPGLADLLGGADHPRFTELVPHLPGLRAAAAGEGPPADAAQALLASLHEQAQLSSRLAAIPPAVAASEVPTWSTPGDVVARLADGVEVPRAHVEVLAAWQALVVAADAGDEAGATRALEALHDRVRGLAAARGEDAKLDLEVFLGRLAPFSRALWGYLAAFLVVAATWIWRRRFLVRIAWGLLLATLLLHVGGIVIRCVLRERPPMSTLYETTLFIAAFGVAVALCVERINGRGLALAIAPILGVVLLFVSNRYEEIQATDTMPQLPAVLDTNFWLATHVTCIGIGYASTLVASCFAHAHLLGRMVLRHRMSRDAEQSLAKTTYGVLCFALLFSVVGTILGGIWANESWGRFWGWDPKENGALLICLVQLATLHGRLGGLWKTWGFAMGTVVCGAVVSFSWWGVNLLEIGLHSYGFTKGVWDGLLTFWSVEAAVLVAAAVHAGRAARRGAPA